MPDALDTSRLGIGLATAVFTIADALLRCSGCPTTRCVAPEQLVIVSDPAAVNTNAVGAPVTDFASRPTNLTGLLTTRLCRRDSEADW